jgi:hypothetical protein
MPIAMTLSNDTIMASIVRLHTRAIDIKIVIRGDMHILQWRRNLLWDEVLVDGRRQGHSTGLWGRETSYGLEFGRDEEGRGGTRLLFTIDPKENDWDWSGEGKASGLRIEGVDGPIVAYGTLDPQNLERPTTFSDALKKTLGMNWKGT